MIKYRDFRTGMTFTDIRRELQGEQTAAKARDEYMFVTRKTVLGRWSYYKRSMYEAYLRSMGSYDPA
jgi:hypothetical protein